MKNIRIIEKIPSIRARKTYITFSIIAMFTLFSYSSLFANAGDVVLLSPAVNDSIVTIYDDPGTASSTASSTYTNLSENKPVSIGMSPDISIDPTPKIIASWQANDDLYTDVDSAAGPQFMPSGRYGINKTIAFCAIMENADPSTLVYAQIYYPESIALGTSYSPIENQSDLGCGELMQEQILLRLNKESGIDLFCNKIKELNNNLPYLKNGYDYGNICRTDGTLNLDGAAIFCGNRNISYGDPSGEYSVKTIAVRDKEMIDTTDNRFTYYPITAFETDFYAIDYGKVKVNVQKTITGDELFDFTDANNPTVRNVGNTRLTIKIIEDDIGLGRTYENWNINFAARVGKKADFTNFEPNTATFLNNSLDLFETATMDFSVEISRFPESMQERHAGTMILSAEAAAHLECN